MSIVNPPPPSISYSQSEQQWFHDLGIDFSLLDLLIEESKELGPEVLRDSKFDPLVTPFELTWTFGFGMSVPIINLTLDDRHEIFYTAAHMGVLYNYCNKKMVHLKGHQTRIISASADKSGRWLVTADNGKDNLIMVWDTLSSTIVWTIFNHPSAEYDVVLVALNPNARLLVTATTDDEHKLDFWLWTYGKDQPDETYTTETNLGLPKAIEFHPNKTDHIMVVFEKAVVFFVWDQEAGKLSQTIHPKCPTKKSIGHYTDGTYVDFCNECFVSTAKGNVLVFGNTIYAKAYKEDEVDNAKIFIKCIKISKGSVHCITSTDEIIATGDSNGTIMFFDKRLKLLYWYAKRITVPIRTISFKLCPRKYQIDYSKSFIDYADPEAIVIPDCDEDRTAEYEILLVHKVPKDASLERRPFVTRDFFISTHGGTIYVINFLKDQIIPLFSTADSYVGAIDVHDELPYIIVGYTKGRLVIFNYDTHEEVISTILPRSDDESSTITAVKFSPQCLHLACGKSNGELWLLQPALLSQVYINPFRFGTDKIVKIAFSHNSLQMAYYDNNMTIFGFYYDTESEDWIYKGKLRSHYKEICNILFMNEEPFGLFTIGKDRYLIKYTDLGSSDEEIDILTRDRIEQKDIPLYFIPHPKKKLSKSNYFLVADDKHKYKLVSSRTNMCTAVYLGPAYGCYQDSPVQKMEFLPKHNQKYFVFMNKKHIGIQLLPVDGNPFRFVGCLGHPEGVVDFQMSHNGKYIFTIGKNDRAVFMWKVKIVSAETMFQLGGEELQPFYCLIEGGRGGFMFQELRDLFYYMQILQQGEQVSAPRIVTQSINVGELPDLMRACGYYPSEYEIENLLTDVRYKYFDDTGVTKDKVTFCEFVKLFINHKPAYGYSLDTLEEAFDTITTFTDDYASGEMSRDDFIEAVTTTGEQVSSEQIFRCLTTLLHVEMVMEQMGERDFSFMDETIDFYTFTENILGIDMASHESRNDDDGGSY